MAVAVVAQGLVAQALSIAPTASQYIDRLNDHGHFQEVEAYCQRFVTDYNKYIQNPDAHVAIYMSGIPRGMRLDVIINVIEYALRTLPESSRREHLIQNMLYAVGDAATAIIGDISQTRRDCINSAWYHLIYTPLKRAACFKPYKSMKEIV